MARAATAEELAFYRSDGKWSKLRAVILKPPIVYRARVNQTFTSYDQVLTLTYDGGTGTLSDVAADMEVWIGSALDAHDKGICRLIAKNADTLWLSETSEIEFAEDDYITIVAAFGVWARPVRINSDDETLMDETAYTDQHTNWDPMPNMGADQVVELTGATVDVVFHSMNSFCYGSSIVSYLWSCPTASATSDPTLANFTVQLDTGGTHLIYLIVTAANGKTFWGVRNVFVIDNDHPAFSAVISNPGRCDVDSGGWEFELTLFGNVDLADVYERAKIILFSDDYYGGTLHYIGPVTGSGNIWFVGWISKESNHLSVEQGSVTFTANGAAFWMGRIPSWPDGVEFTAGTPDWTSIPNLTVDLGIYHFLRWRSTVTRVMDVVLTGDAKLCQEVSSSSQNLWSQLQDMTWSYIYARPGVNALNQLSVQVHPSLIPTAERAYPTVMAITKADYVDGLDFDRETVDAVGIVDMSGVQVTAPGKGSAWFALAPGHSLPHYGDWDIQSNLLLESQEQVITLAGLYRSWQNNKFKSIQIVFDACIRLIDCFPNQRCTINIASADNIRGWAYSGGLIPIAVQLVQDPETGYCHSQVTFEAQTSESMASVGDTPGSDTTTDPPIPPIPPIIIPPIIIPGTITPSTNGPKTVLFHDTVGGAILATDFDTTPVYTPINSGLGIGVLGANQKQKINWMGVCPNGAVYVAWIPGSELGSFIARAPSLGGTFEILYEQTTASVEDPNRIWAVGINPLLAESVAFVRGALHGTRKIYVGSYGGYAGGVSIPPTMNVMSNALSFGLNYWLLTYYGLFMKISANGSSIVASGASPSYDITVPHLRASTTGFTYHPRNGVSAWLKGTNNLASLALLNTDSIEFEDINGARIIDCDPTGQYQMGNAASVGGKGKSADFGATWAANPSLPPGNYCFGHAGPGDNAALPRFVAAGAVVRYTPDFGLSWVNKENASLTAINPFPAINMVCVVEP